MNTPFTDLLSKARKAKYKMKYQTDAKPPKGFVQVEGGKGYRSPKKVGGRYRYWYPWKYSNRVAQHGQVIGAEEGMHVGSRYSVSTQGGGEAHLEVVSITGPRVKIKNTDTGNEKWMTKKQLTRFLRDHHAAEIASHKEFLKRKVAEAALTGTAKQKATWFDEARRYGVVYDGEIDLGAYKAGTKPSNISLTRHEDIAPRIEKSLPQEVTQFPNPNEEEGYYSLFRHQEEGIARALQSWEERDGFLLQDEAGLGKTLTAIGALIARGGKRNLIIVPTRGGKGLKGQWQEAADLYNLNLKNPKEGGDGYFVATYRNLVDKVKGPDGEWIIKLKPEFEGKFDSIIFDESHSMANPRSSEGQAGVMLQDNADKVMYMSATPYTNLRDTHYMRKMGWFKDGGEFVNWAEKLGARIGRRAGEAGAIPFNVDNPRSVLPSVAVAAMLHSSGAGIKRVPNYAALTNRAGENINLNVKFEPVKSSSLSKDFQNTLSLAEEAKKIAIQAGLNPLTTGGRMFGWKRMAWEAAKADRAVELAKERLDKDPKSQVLIFSDGIRFSEQPVRNLAESIRYRVNETGTLPESALVYADQIDALADQMTRRNTIEYMTQQIGSHLAGRELTPQEAKEYVAQVHGGADAKEETQRYQRGDVRVIIGTMKKGGTGLSYHDRSGDAPRTQINLSLPLGGADYQQVSGRSFRMGSQSDVEMLWLHGDDPFEERLGSIVGKKLQNMGALVEGNPGANVSAEEMISWENARGTDGEDYEEAVQSLTVQTNRDSARRARDFFRDTAERMRVEDGQSVLEEVGFKITGERDRTRDRRARYAIGQLGAIGIGVKKTGDGIMVTGAKVGTPAYNLMRDMYSARGKKKSFQIAKYHGRSGTWSIRDPNEVRKIAKKLGVSKMVVEPPPAWDDSALAGAVTAFPSDAINISKVLQDEWNRMNQGDEFGPFSNLVMQAKAGGK